MTPPNELLVQALVKLCDDYSELHQVSGPNAVGVVQDLTGLYFPIDQPYPWTWWKSYQELLGQAEVMIKRHYGVTQLNNDILEELLEDIEDLEETANE